MLNDRAVLVANKSLFLRLLSWVRSSIYSYYALKRAMDISSSFLLLVLSAPLMIIVALLIKLNSPGPVIYKQERCTKDGKIFLLYKFRSMPHNIENGNGPEWGRTDDPRCTRFGRYLRILLIDELPQLVNVLKGDMSLVGPRPERAYFIKRFKTIIKDYDLRHRVKAGLTGWAQVNGYRGNTSIVKRVEHDLHYIQNRSILFDLKIILMTPFSIRIPASNARKKALSISEKKKNSPAYKPVFSTHLCFLHPFTCFKNMFSEKINSL